MLVPNTTNHIFYPWGSYSKNYLSCSDYNFDFCSNAAIPISSASSEDRRSRADIAASFQVAIYMFLLFSLSLFFYSSLFLFYFFIHLAPADTFLMQRVAVLHLEERCQRAMEWALKIEPSIKHLVM